MSWNILISGLDIFFYLKTQYNLMSSLNQFWSLVSIYVNFQSQYILTSSLYNLWYLI